jgi:hypothetical protein
VLADARHAVPGNLTEALSDPAMLAAARSEAERPVPDRHSTRRFLMVESSVFCRDLSPMSAAPTYMARDSGEPVSTTITSTVSPFVVRSG